MENKYDGLREFLKENPVGYDSVFFNLKGEWLFSQQEATAETVKPNETVFDIEYSREDVLKSGFEGVIEKEIEKRGKKANELTESAAETTENLKNKK